MPPKAPRGELPSTHLHWRAAWKTAFHELRSIELAMIRMRVAEASAVMPLSPEEAWDVLIGGQMHQLVEMPEVSVVAVEDYEVRSDGTARYRVANKAGPSTIWHTAEFTVYDDGTARYRVANKAGPSTIWHTAEFTVYERPNRSVNRVLESPFGGTFYGIYEPMATGDTRVSWRWEVEPQNPLAAVVLPMMRPLFARSMQHDLDALAKGGGATPEEDRQRRSVAAKASLLGGAFVVGAILVLYLLGGRRSSAAKFGASRK
jgi:hypothetical protein